MIYDHKKIERAWQAYWNAHKTFVVHADDATEKKYYVLDMFPYPSGEGLHVGHPEGYTATDIYSRFLRMNGHTVLHPMGWDAFGLPAENYAIKKRVHPAETTKKNTANFRRQIQSLGFSYDWSREINTSSPEYYRWTQWLFLQLFKHGLAYKKRAPINWCEGCQTVLANEQVVDGACERCHTAVIQKELEQWFLKVTAYAERLLAGLRDIDWPDPIKRAQEHWIGRSEGALIDFRMANTAHKITVFTTRPDTLYGATYIVLAPEHPLVERPNYPIGNLGEVRAYIEQTKRKSELERKSQDRKKTGVLLKGVTALHPATQEKIPLWIADYVLPTHGTGAIMGVPAHDDRDLAFAKKFNLPMKIVIMPDAPEKMFTRNRGNTAYTGPGMLVSSGPFSNRRSEDAKNAIVKHVGGRETVQYKLRDWLISRQRYWGAPIPIIYCDTCGMQSVPEHDLPVLLPTDVDFLPTGESPLVGSQSFHNVSCPACGKRAARESDTIDTFMCSSWYYLRYLSPHATTEPFAKKIARQWLPVDLYVGGAEHAVLHLLYARFIAKALADMGHLDIQEPFLRLKNQGLILGEDGEKMSKSRGNVINPDEVVETYGADTFRLYEMFMGPFEDAKPWNAQNIMGVRRFVERVWRIYQEYAHAAVSVEHAPSERMARSFHKTIKKVTEDIRDFRFNTAISALMICANDLSTELKTNGPVPRAMQEAFVLLIAPFTPHVAEELWQMLGHANTLAYEPWPSYDQTLIAEDTFILAIQVNGRTRDTVECAAGIPEDEAISMARARPNVKKWIDGKNIKKTISIKERLINFVL